MAAASSAELTPGAIVSSGLKIGMANYFSLLGAMILWGLTIWVPYINVGTTIAMATLPIAMGQGQRISPLEIFDPKYRQFMGEMFVQWGLKGIGLYMGMIFLFVPAIVLQLSWCLSELLIVDKQMNPAEALAESNKRMAGYKWTVFFGMLLTGLIIAAVALVLGLLMALLINTMGQANLLIGILGFVLYLGFIVFAMAAGMGTKAFVYETLK